MNESTPNIQSRIVQYTMQNGTEVTQRRSYVVSDDHKWRQVKNMDAWAMVEDTIDSYADLMPAELKATQSAVAEVPAEANYDLKEKFVDPSETVQRRVLAAKAVGAVAVERPSFWSRAKEAFSRPAAKLALGATAVALALTGLASTSRYDSAEQPREDRTETATGEINGSQNISSIEATTTSTTEAPTTSTTMNEAELQARYGGESTGEHTVYEIGAFDIDPANSEQTMENLFNEIRHNSDAQAFWNACLETGTPSYDACVADPSVLANANRMAELYRTQPLTHKATNAESTIAKFKKATFNGITVESGHYQTVAIGSNGEFIASSNTRDNDPIMNFTFEGDDGKMYEVDIRSCVQIVKRENPAPTPTPPVVEKPPVETPPKEETPPTTVPETTTTTVPEEETTTTTAPEETTTTVPETTTTTVPETTTTTGPTTTTVVTVPPKGTPKPPAGEVTTTVTAGEPTPPEPTTSIAPQPSTSSTAPADTLVPTTAPEIPVDQPPINNDSIFPFLMPLGGSLGLVTLAEKKKRANAAKKA